MTQPLLPALLTMALLSACSPELRNTQPEVHGHRGCRGLLPENTIDGFKKAAEMGCDHLELDVVLSGDGQVIVSHEPWLNAAICLGPEGEELTEEQGRSFNLHRMRVDEIQRCDCGSLEQERFPEQDTRRSVKPTLRAVVEAVDEHALLTGVPNPSYNIEIKSDPAWYGIYQPQPAPYASQVIATIDSLGISERCIVQSFDPAILEAVHAERPDLTLALLVENTDDLRTNLARLSFKPAIYSPYFKLANDDLLTALRSMDIELVVWTVNEPADIQQMVKLGVDGIISDYPDRVIAALEGR
ncbi:MAG: glycerophosphodiester phosphodiesterase [Flavobacteriales bacterium]|jgi:glycerophosphoryl diester phosphodiesterase|nr:glycerophosphodiester phosphodiesterase [Flavobacteriales bacterium]